MSTVGPLIVLHPGPRSELLIPDTVQNSTAAIGHSGRITVRGACFDIPQSIKQCISVFDVQTDDDKFWHGRCGFGARCAFPLLSVLSPRARKFGICLSQGSGSFSLNSHTAVWLRVAWDGNVDTFLSTMANLSPGKDKLSNDTLCI